MAEQDIIQSLISRLGQSQGDRLPAELDRHFVDVDERTPLDLVRRMAALATKLRFYSQSPVTSDGDWASFFPKNDALAAQLLSCDDGSVTPHLGLLIAFLRLYDRYPRQALNALTGRHLDFQFRRVLGFTPRGARPDRAHVLLALKKGAPTFALPEGHEFSAGKDAGGKELVYRAVREVVINDGAVADLKSVFHDGTRLRIATQANSADGRGAPFASANPQWRPFGSEELADAQIGFALASPVLRLAEGARTVVIELSDLQRLDPKTHTSQRLADAFTAEFSGPQGWVKAETLSVDVVGNRMTVTVTLSRNQPAFVDYDVGVHGKAFATQAPVLRILFRQDGPLRYRDVADIKMGSVMLRVRVNSLTAVEVENDFGKLNAKKAFQPFGPQPVVGAALQVRCEEALSKRLRRLALRLAWQGAPADLHDWYVGYSKQASLVNGVGGRLVFQDRDGLKNEALGILLPRKNVLSAEAILQFERSPSKGDAKVAEARPSSLDFSEDDAWSGVTRRSSLDKFDLNRRRSSTAAPAATARSGFVTITLDNSLLHEDYLFESVQNVLGVRTPANTKALTLTALSSGPQVLRPPYTPTLRSISLDYEAESAPVDLARPTLDSFTQGDVQFFHIGCFGEMREHAYLRENLPSLANASVYLLPRYEHEGEFLVGVRGVGAGDSLSLLTQAVEGSGDPDLAPQTLQWSVLSDNYWLTLTPDELSLDSSQGLRTSGILALSLPATTTTSHSLMPTGMVWLRATIHENSRSTCQLMFVGNNAAEVEFLVSDDQDATHLSAALPAGTITKSRAPLRFVQRVTQPFASFGGQTAETDDMLARRAAERLRHRRRCVAAWDYERMVLDAFPGIHKVKCVPHANERSWTAPGHVMLIVVPDLRNRHAVDPLRPRVDVGTLSQVTEFVQRHCGMQVRIFVRNPRFQEVKVSCLVRFRAGLSFHHYRRQLDEALLRVLSPWAFDAARPIEFGGVIQRSVLLNFVEELPYVDFVTEFKLTSDGANSQTDAASVAATTPDAILVSSPSHDIGEYKGN